MEDVHASALRVLIQILKLTTMMKATVLIITMEYTVEIDQQEKALI